MIIHVDTRKILKSLLMCFSGMLASALTLRWSKNSVVGFGGLAVFGYLAIQHILTAMRADGLRIDDEGIAWVSKYGGWNVAWREIFYIRRSSHRRLIEIRALGGKEQTVPNILAEPVDNVLARLEDRLAAARANMSGYESLGGQIASFQEPAAPRPVFPSTSIGITSLLCAMFCIELTWPVTAPTQGSMPSLLTLLAWGGLNRPLVLEQGEWYRLVSAPLLHASVSHLLFNCVALLLAGRALEGLAGRAWFIAIFVFGAGCGSIGSLLVMPPNLIGVGASGAIMALFAAALTISFKFPSTQERSKLQARCLVLFIPALLSSGKVDGGMLIDWGDHLGGAIGGVIAGLLLFRAWTDLRALPRFVPVARAFGGVGAVVALLTLIPSVRHYGALAARSQLINPADMPNTDQDFVEKSASLVQNYPRDPRAHLVRSIVLSQQKHYEESEREARFGLADPLMLRDNFAPVLETNLWVALATSLTPQGRGQEALEALDKAVARTPGIAAPHVQRASVRLHLGLLDDALDDTRIVIDAESKSPLGHVLAGNIWFAKGDLRHTIDEEDRALDLAADDESALRQRGFARFFAGHSDEARADLDKAVIVKPSDHYAALWREIVGQRTGLGGPSITSDGSLDRSVWPGPAVKLFEGAVTPDEVLRSARSSDAVIDRDQTCEADFYVGEWNLTHRQDESGIQYLAAAEQLCPHGFTEWAAARFELALHVVPGSGRPSLIP